MVTVSLRFDEHTKDMLDKMCDEMGMNLTTFFMIYARAALREKRIPFEIRADADGFYSRANINAIRRSETEKDTGKVLEKTLDELEDLEK